MEDKKSQKREHEEAQQAKSNDEKSVCDRDHCIDEQTTMEEKKPNTLMWGNRSFGSGLLLSKSDSVSFYRQIQCIEE